MGLKNSKMLIAGVELVSCTIVGSFIGIYIDRYFETKPLWSIIFFFLGSVAGMLNVIKIAKKM